MPKTFPVVNYGYGAGVQGFAGGFTLDPLISAILARRKKKEEEKIAAQEKITKEKEFQRGERIKLATEVFKSSGGELPADVLKDIGIETPEAQAEWGGFFKEYFSKQDKAKKQADLSTFNTMLRLGYPISEEKMIENGIDPETAKRLATEIETRSSAKQQTLDSVLAKNRALTQYYLQMAYYTGTKRDMYGMFQSKFQKNDAATQNALKQIQSDEALDIATQISAEMTPQERDNLFNMMVTNLPATGKQNLMGGVGYSVDMSKDKLWLQQLKRLLDERDTYSTQMNVIWQFHGTPQGKPTPKEKNVLDLD